MTRSITEMTGIGLLVDLRHRGLKVDREGDRLRVAPKKAITPEVRDTLARRKGELVAALSLEARVLQTPLERFEREGRSIEVRVPWLPESLWFVSGPLQVQRLAARGISRGRIWTARELALVWKTPNIDKRRVVDLGRVKADLGAEIVSLELPGDFGMRRASGA